MRIRRLALAALFVALSFMAGHQVAKAVVFGTEMTDASEKAPWVAAIWYAETPDANPEFICTGSLITKDVIITAAHCAFDKGFYWVRLKSDTLKSEEPLREVAAVWLHERYNKKTTQNDLGLLKLSDPVDDIKPIAIPKKSEVGKLSSSKKFQILGWGNDQLKTIAKFLRYANLIDQSGAAKRTYGRFFNPVTMVSAGRYIPAERVFAGGCNGDSGGPLTTMLGDKTVLVGLTSWGSAQGCDKGKPTIFTKLTYYVSDIGRGLKLVEKSAQRYNRALPRNIEKVQIFGEPRVGSTLTCNQGAWSENTTDIEVTWQSPNRISGSTNPVVKVEDGDGGEVFACEVRGASAAGELVVGANVKIPERPQAVRKPVLIGITNTEPPKVGQSVSCSAPTWSTTIEQESKRTWFVSSEYSPDNGPRSSTEVGSGNSLTFTKENLLLAQGKYLYCRVQALTAGGIGTTWGFTQVMSISRPYPNIRISGYSSSLPPKINTQISCDVTKPNQYETIVYSWSINDGGNRQSAALAGTTDKLQLTREVILAAKGKNILCTVKATNIVGEGEDTAGIYIVPPQLPSLPETAISGLDLKSIKPDTSVVQCDTRTLIEDELLSYEWGISENQYSNTIKTFLGNQKFLPLTAAIMDDLPGSRLVCKATVQNLAGKSDSSAGVDIPVPDVQFFSKTGRFYKFVSTTASWTEARRLALASAYEGMQGYLATPNTAAELAFMRKKASGAEIWIGISDALNEGCWRYTDGPEANLALYAAAGVANCTVGAGAFSSFGPGEPNNNPGLADGYQNVAYVRADGTWDDSLNSSYFAYVIEYGGTVATMSGAPSNTVTPVITLTAPLPGAITRGTVTVSGSVELERFNNLRPSNLGIKITGASSPSFSPTLVGSTARLNTGSSWLVAGATETSDFNWSTTARTFTITFDAGAFADGEYAVTIYSREPNGVSGKTTTTFVVPQAVRNVLASTIGDSQTSIYLTWTAPTSISGISDYQVEYSAAGGEWQKFTRNPSLASAATITGISPAIVYQFRVTPVINKKVNLALTTLSNTVSTAAPVALSIDSFSSLTGWSIIKEVSGAWNPSTLRPYLRLEAANYDPVAKTWVDSSGNNRHLASSQVKGAPTLKTTTIGNGSAKAFTVVSGGVNDGIKLGNPSFNSFGFLTVARYSGVTQRRIFTGETGNHLTGWSSGKTGVAYHEAWITETSSGNNNNWFLISDTWSSLRVNGASKGVGRNPTLPQMTINWGNPLYGSETSDWEVAEVIVFDRNLSVSELSLLEDYLGGTYGITAYSVGATYNSLAPRIEAGKLRMLSIDGGRAGALNLNKLDSARGIDARFRFNFGPSNWSFGGDGFTFFLADSSNPDIAAAANGGGNWLGVSGGATLAYAGNNPGEQFKGGLLGIQILHKNSPKVQVLGRTGTNSTLPILKTSNVSIPMGQDMFMRIQIDPVGLATRSYRIWISNSNSFSGNPTITGLLSDNGINWNDPSGGVQFGFSGATGDNVMNIDIDRIVINGITKN
jgi:hypothetical protein